jgi:hypothetical protein
MTLREVCFRLPTRWGDPGVSAQLDEETALRLIASGHAEEIGTFPSESRSTVDRQMIRPEKRGIITSKATRGS